MKTNANKDDDVKPGKQGTAKSWDELAAQALGASLLEFYLYRHILRTSCLKQILQVAVCLIMSQIMTEMQDLQEKLITVWGSVVEAPLGLTDHSHLVILA